MGNEFKRISRREMLAAQNEAKAINSRLTVSDDINRSDIVKLGDAAFFDRVMFSFENNRYANAIFLNEIKDREYSDFASSHNVEFDPIESSVRLSDIRDTGIYISTELSTSVEKRGLLNDFFLIVDEDVPAGTDILYYLITNYDEVFPIKPNSTIPLRLEENVLKPISFKIKAVLKPNGNDEPKLRGLAVLYYDSAVEAQLGLINPDLVEIDKEDIPVEDDVVTIIRDPEQEDRLVRVVSSVDDVKLTYSVDGEELELIETFDYRDGSQVDESRLIYGDYLNSENEVERVLLQVRTRTNF